MKSLTNSESIYQSPYSEIILPNKINLSSAEELKAQKFINHEAKVKYIKRHITLHNILAKYLTNYKICYDDNGYLFLSNHKINISISHSADFFIIALSKDKKIGVDIEHLEQIDNLQAKAKFFLNEDELDYLQNSNYNMIIFYKFWTAKEAILKAIGLGFLVDAKKLNICLDQMRANFIFNQYSELKISFKYQQSKNYLTCVAHI